MIRQITGQNSPELVAKIKELITQNQTAAGAAAGGLGTILLGTKTGRSLTLDAAKLGGLVLIGGLAYKAYQNYTQGQPATGQSLALFPPTPAPAGSGFEAEVQTPDHACLYMRAMIAAAAADGQIDEKEQANIFGGLKQVGMSAHAVEFLQDALQDPPTVEDLVRACDTPKTALQVYAAARVAIEPDLRKGAAVPAATSRRPRHRPQACRPSRRAGEWAEGVSPGSSNSEIPGGRARVRPPGACPIMALSRCWGGSVTLPQVGGTAETPPVLQRMLLTAK